VRWGAWPGAKTLTLLRLGYLYDVTCAAVGSLEDSETYDGRPVKVQTVVVTDDSGTLAAVRTTHYLSSAMGRTRPPVDLAQLLGKVWSGMA